jgi:LPS sulfotransferase NodH
MRAADLPNFFIIGAARSGTTLLAEMLRLHPDVFITEPKEPHFLAFSAGLPQFQGPGDDVMLGHRAVIDYDSYISLYRRVNGESARGDGSVSTLYYPEASIRTLRHYFPESRLVVVLRNPIDRAYSAYSYLRARGFEPCDDFLDAVRYEVNGDREKWHHLWHYVAMGLYARQLRHFFDAFGSSPLRIVFFDELQEDPVSVAQGVCEFLGVDATLPLTPTRVNVSGQPRSALVQRAVQWVGHHRLARSTIRRAAPFRFREAIRRANLRPDAVSSADADALRPLFREDVADLADLLTKAYPNLAPRMPPWLTTARHEAVANS